VELLAYCKSLGQVTVGLNSDESVKRLKGVSRPMNTESDRKRILEALRYVDEVVIFHEDTPYDLISKLKPDVIVKGGDYRANDVIGSDICDVIIFDMVPGYSTTSIITRIISK
jgi:D-beta-D-heptose 7-phosphate kinase/D-beta-D-heptose 1-phosphate adenosyltransferase